MHQKSQNHLIESFTGFEEKKLINFQSITRSQILRCMPSAPSVNAPCMLCARCVQAFCTLRALSVHPPCTLLAPSMHALCMLRARSVHTYSTLCKCSMHTLCTLCASYMHAPCTLHECSRPALCMFCVRPYKGDVPLQYLCHHEVFVSPCCISVANRAAWYN